MDIQNDETAQRLLGLQYMFESGGFRILENEVNELVVFAEDQIAQSSSEGYYNADKLSKLNYDLGRKNGLSMVRNVLQQLKEELENTSLAER